MNHSIATCESVAITKHHLSPGPVTVLNTAYFFLHGIKAWLTNGCDRQHALRYKNGAKTVYKMLEGFALQPLLQQQPMGHVTHFSDQAPNKRFRIIVNFLVAAENHPKSVLNICGEALLLVQPHFNSSDLVHADVLLVYIVRKNGAKNVPDTGVSCNYLPMMLRRKTGYRNAHDLAAAQPRAQAEGGVNYVQLCV